MGDLGAGFLDSFADELAERIAAKLEPRTEAAAGNGAGEWQLLTLPDVAGRLGRSERWVRDRVKSGDLARVRLDAGPFAFLLEDVIAFAEARRVGGQELR